ncbi:MAG: T9SS type A sorting domain-containing protein [Saprospiraceae bacterium]|nr:T9SS type A sorting domain-containing protein [Saprospiraceae bacterium]
MKTLILPVLFISLFSFGQTLPTSILLVGEEGRDLQANGFTSFLDGKYCIYGAIDDNALFSFYTNEGVLESRFEIDLNTTNQYVHYLIESESGVLYGIIRKPGTQGLPQFVFAMDPNSKDIIWIQEFNSSDLQGSRFESLVEDVENGVIMVFGMIQPGSAPGGGQDYMLLKLDPETGAILGNYIYSMGDTDNFRDAFKKGTDLYTSGTLRGTTGLSSIRPCIGKFDTNGNLTWLKYYVKPKTESARVYAPKMVSIPDGMVVAGYGSLNSTSVNNYSLQVYKVNYEGDYQWGLDLSPNQSDLKVIEANGIIGVEDGYVVGAVLQDGESNFRALIYKISLDGNFLWAKEIGLIGSMQSFGLDSYPGRMLISGTAHGIDNNQFVANLNKDGEVEGTDCLWVKPFALDYTELLSETYIADPVSYEPVFSLELFSDFEVFGVEATSNEVCLGITSSFGINTEKEKFLVFPNPASSQLNIETPASKLGKKIEVKITDLTGRLVLAENSVAEIFTIQLPNIESGIYFVSFWNEEGMLLQTNKFTIIQ